MNAVTCDSKVGCICNKGYTGQNCDIIIDPCVSKFFFLDFIISLYLIFSNFYIFKLKTKDITVPSFSICINNQGQALFICEPGYTKPVQENSTCTRKRFLNSFNSFFYTIHYNNTQIL